MRYDAMTQRMMTQHLHGRTQCASHLISRWTRCLSLVAASTLLLPLHAQLSLPYNGTTASSTTLFQITQRGTGGVASFSLVNPSATTPALFAQTSASQPAIFARSLKTSGAIYGALFEVRSSEGRGVLGYARATTGATIGVYGLSESVAGTGVLGAVYVTSGRTYGVRGKVLSPSGYAGYFEGRGYFSGNLGIGTPNPSQKLHVEGNSYFNGNVGIGTSSPAARLSLGSDNANTKLALWQGSGANDLMGFGIGPGQFRLHLHHSGNRFSFLNAPNGTEIMTILGSGNVGIGTSSPSERLHVNGNIRLADDRSIFGLDQLMGYNDLRLYGDANGGPDLFIAANGNVGIGTGSPSQRLHVEGVSYFNGNVGIGTSSPRTRLHVEGNGFFSGDALVGGNWLSVGGGGSPYDHWRVAIRAVDAGGGQWVGYIETRGANESSNVLITFPSGHPNHGSVSVYNAANNIEAGIYVDPDGYGIVWGDFKNFRVPDPEDPTRDIWYASIEGPEAAMYVRGTARLVNGRAWIELPDHFRKLADEQGMTVQLTPLSPDSKGLCVVRKGLDGIEVVELLNGRGNYEFDWRVEAVRKEHRNFQVYRPWDEVLPGGIDPAEAWEARLKSIQARQARQQAQNTK